jgi:hypothetical protein
VLFAVDRNLLDSDHSSLTLHLFPLQIASLPFALTYFWMVIRMTMEKGLACWPCLQGVPLYKTSMRSNKIARPLITPFLLILVFTRLKSQTLTNPICGEDQTTKLLKASPGS